MRSTYILCSDFDTTRCACVSSNPRRMLTPVGRLPELSSEFERAFPALLPLPALLARLTPSDSYVAAVADRHVGLRSSHLPALIWLLSRNVVNKQRIFIRVVASQEIKRRSQVHWGGSDFSSLAGKDDSRLSISSDAVDTAAALDIPASHSTSYSGGGGGFSSASGQQRRRMPSKPATFSTTSSRSRRASEDDGTRPSIIIEPGRPSVIERRWLAEMVRDKGPNMRDSFDKYVYLDPCARSVCPDLYMLGSSACSTACTRPTRYASALASRGRTCAPSSQTLNLTWFAFTTRASATRRSMM